MNIAEQISTYKHICPAKPAVKLPYKTLTYRELNDSLNMVANGLLSKDRVQGLKVAILLNNSIEFLQIFLGALKAGWTPVLLDPKWSSREIIYILEECKPKLVFIEEGLLKKLGDIEKAANLVVVNTKGNKNKQGFIDFNSWVNKFSTDSPRIKYDNKILFLGFTSGTTGKPKGYLRTHDSWIESFYAANYELGVNFNNTVMAPGPLVHSLSLYAAVYTLFLGATFYLIDKFNPLKLLNGLNTTKKSVVYLVPTMIQAVIDLIQEDKVKFRAPKKIISSGSKWSKDLKKEVKKYFKGVGFFEFYGSSEASFVTVLGSGENEIKPDSVGRAFKNVRISIRNEEGQELGVNEVGRIYVASNMIFLGYFPDESKTKEILKDGWLMLEDFGKRDKDDYIYLTGRVKNMLISGGLKVFPEEVEQVLLGLEEVKEVMVMGVIDQYWGDKIVALIRWQDNQVLDLLKIRNYCQRYLASYKAPQEVITVKKFLYTASGKIARKKMKIKLMGDQDGRGSHCFG